MTKRNPFAKLVSRLVTYEPTLGDGSHLDNYNSLLANLLSIGKFAFDEDYIEYAKGREILWSLFPALSDVPNKANSVIEAYIADFEKNNGAEKFLKKYPLLPTLINKRVEQNREHFREIEKRFYSEKSALAEKLNNAKPLGDLISIQLDVGDFHQNGKSTAILGLSCGTTIVYKPRSGGLDIAFNLLIGELNRAIPDVDLKMLAVLDMGTYLWSEYVGNSPVGSEAALKDYYRRCGYLTAISYLLMGTDFHFENVVACGEYPVLVDLECLFNFTNMASYNVLNTGLIPSNFYAGDNTTPCDVSGFGASGTKKSGIDVWAWENVDSDAIGLARKMGTFRAKTNQPILNKKKISPENYVADLVTGFEKVCCWFLANKHIFSNSNHPLIPFENRTIRLIARTTENYRSVLENSYIPDALISTVARRGIIDSSLREHSIGLPVSNETKENLIEMELKAMERMDTPYILGNTSCTHISESNSRICENYFPVSPYEFVLDRIKKLDESGIKSQAILLESAYRFRYGKSAAKTRLDAKQPDESFSLIDEIGAIADAISGAVCKNGDAYFWDGYAADGGDGLANNTRGGSLYCGASGISLFLSAVSKFTGQHKYDEVIRSVLEAEITAAFDRAQTLCGGGTDISFSAGISGLIHALIRVDFSRYEKIVLKLSCLITPELIFSERRLDFMGGGAGCLTVLAELYRRTKAAQVLKTMILIGDHLLLNRQVDKASGQVAWMSDNFPKALTGFSHGASGIGYSLLQLHNITGDLKYRDAFYSAIDFENFYFEKSVNNWRDLRGRDADFETAWCHGAPGVGLSRLYAYGILRDDRLLADVKAAILATKCYSSSSKDFYCCGNSGRLDFLLEASRVLQDDNLFRYVKKKIESLIMQKNAHGHYQTQNISDVSVENPSLFRGTSGIGYLLLRCLDPEMRCVIP